MPLRQLGAFYHARAEAIAAAEEMMPYFKTESLSASPSQEFKAQKIDLILEQLCFSYPNKTIFNNFSLNIPFGACLAITGESGAGKSTLLHLIAKLIAPQAGKITANKVDITTLNDDNFRSYLSLLHQHPRLQTGTIYENIAFAKSNATRADVFSFQKTYLL